MHESVRPDERTNVVSSHGVVLASMLFRLEESVRNNWRYNVPVVHRVR